MSVTLARTSATRTARLVLRPAFALTPLTLTLARTATAGTARTMSSLGSDKAPNFDFPEKQPSQSERELVEDVIKLCELDTSLAVYGPR